MHPEPRAHARLRPRTRTRRSSGASRSRCRAACPRRRCASSPSSARAAASGIAEIVAPDRDLVPGVEIETDLGTWTVHETPGHAPSHVCLHQADRRVLISGDHLLGRVSLYYDVGYSPDPAGEFLRSLDVVDELDARAVPLRPRPHVHRRARATSRPTARRSTERLEKVRAVDLRDGREPLTAFEAVPLVYGEPVTPLNANWWLDETLAYLIHLEATGRAERIPGETPHGS